MKKKILILGGGFGGVYVTKYLLKKGFQITLINDKNYFLFTPLLVAATAGTLNKDDIIFDYLDFFNNKKITFIKDNIKKIDTEKKEIILENNYSETYDYLVIATGSKTNYYGIKEEKYTYPLKNIIDANNIKRKIISLCSSNKHEILNINIVGAGPTGIELSIELEDLICEIEKNLKKKIKRKINLINATPNILPQLKKKNQKYVKNSLKKDNINLILSAQVSQIKENSIIINNQEMPSSITIWTAGVKPNTQMINKNYLDKNQKIIINDYLQIDSKKEIFALGDIITHLEYRFPPLAQTATKQARIVSQNIINLIEKKPLKKYKLKLKGVLISLGKKNAIGEIKNITLKSHFGWFIYRTIYLFKMPGNLNKLKIIFTWTIYLFKKKNLVED